MDGPTISGGGGGVEISAGFVTISADLAPLRAAEQEAREIYGRITSMGGSANPNMGSAGTPTAMISLRIDESALRGQVEAAVKAIGPIRLPVELVMPTGAAGTPQEAVRGTSAGWGNLPASQNIVQDLPAAAEMPMRRVGRRTSEAEEILAAMERNQTDAAARGDTAAVARLQSAMAPLQQAIGGVGPSLVAPPGVAGAAAQAFVNPWTTGTFAYPQPAPMAGYSGGWATATGMQTPQVNPWTTATFASAGTPSQFSSPWTTATQMFGPPRPPTYFNTAADEAVLMRAFDEDMEDQAEDERFGLNRQRTQRATPGSVSRRPLGAFRRARNPFSIYGIGTQLGARLGGVGTGIAIAFAAEAALRLGSGLAEAGYEESNFEKYTSPYQFSGADTSQFVAPARELSSRQASISRAGAVESIPLLGSVIQFGDEISGLATVRRGRLAKAQQALSAEVGLEQESFQSQVESLSIQGRSVEAARVVADRSNRAVFSRLVATPEFARLGGLDAEANGTAAGNTQWQEYYEIERANQLKIEQARREENTTMLGLRDRARISGMQASAYTASIQFNAPLSQQEQAALNEFTMIHGEYTPRGQAAIEQFQREQRPGAIVAQQQVEMETLKSEQATKIGAMNPNDPTLPGVVAAASQERIALEAKQAAERIQIAQDTEIRITQITLRGEADRLIGQRDAFGARMASMRSDAVESEAAAYKGLLAAPRSTPQQVALAYREYGAVFESNIAAQDSAGESHRRDLADAMGRGQVGIAESFAATRASELRMSGDQYGAGLQRFMAEQAVLRERTRQAQANPSIIQRGIQMAGIMADQGRLDAERREYQGDYQRQNSEEMFSLQGRAQAAQDISADMPVAARAESGVNRARLEYEELRHRTTDPRILGQARSSLAAELEAQRHELIGQRGGGVAIDMSLASAVLLPPGVDLTGHMADVQRAGAVIQRGIGAVRGGEGIPVVPNLPSNQSSGGDMTQLMTDAKQAIAKFMSAVEKFAGAKGVALFQ